MNVEAHVNFRISNVKDSLGSSFPNNVILVSSGPDQVLVRRVVFVWTFFNILILLEFNNLKPWPFLLSICVNLVIFSFHFFEDPLTWSVQVSANFHFLILLQRVGNRELNTVEIPFFI